MRGVVVSLVVHAGVALGVARGAPSVVTHEASAPPATVDIDVETVAEAAPVVIPTIKPEVHPAPALPIARPPAGPSGVPSATGPRAPEAVAAPSPMATTEAPVPEAPPEMPRFTLKREGAGVTATPGAAAPGTPAGVTTSGSGAGDAVYSIAQVSSPAQLLRSVTAAYPPEARADEREGDVAVEIVVDETGAVSRAAVTRGAGTSFDAAALAAVRAYRFRAAQRNGQPVRVRMPWTVQFRLR